jgi:hypothetical protein
MLQCERLGLAKQLLFAIWLKIPSQPRRRGVQDHRSGTGFLSASNPASVMQKDTTSPLAVRSIRLGPLSLTITLSLSGRAVTLTQSPWRKYCRSWR